jgi:hypothetical protein
VVDASGCALVRQEMDGPFESPVVNKPSFIESAAGPVINIFRGTARLITGEKCEVFYNGSVAAPREWAGWNHLSLESRFKISMHAINLN